MQKFKEFYMQHPIIYSLIILGLIICIIDGGMFSSCSSKGKSQLSGFSKYKVSITTTMLENTGVGNEFEFTYQVNGNFVSNNSVITASSSLQCWAKVVERDSYKYPDVGMNSTTINSSQTNIGQVLVTVKENGGVDNAGTYAIFRVTFKFKGVK